MDNTGNVRNTLFHLAHPGAEQTLSPSGRTPLTSTVFVGSAYAGILRRVGGWRSVTALRSRFVVLPI